RQVPRHRNRQRGLEAREAIVADCENYRHDRCQRQKTKWQSQPPRQRRASALTTRRDFLSATDYLPSTRAVSNCESQIGSGSDSVPSALPTEAGETPALPCGSKRASFRFCACIGTMNRDEAAAVALASRTAAVLCRFCARGPDPKAPEDWRTPKPRGVPAGSWKESIGWRCCLGKHCFGQTWVGLKASFSVLSFAALAPFE